MTQMLEAKLASGALLKNIVDAIKDVIMEAVWVCDQTGIKMNAMDGSHIALCVMELNVACFANYKCTRPVSLGLSIKSLSKVIKAVSNDCTVTIKHVDGADTVIFIFETKKNSLTFEIKTMDITSESLYVPDGPQDYDMLVDATEFRDIVNQFAEIGDRCIMRSASNGLTLSVSGDIGTGSILIARNASTKIVQAGVHVFALPLLRMFIKATPLAKNVRITLSRDQPIALHYDMEKDTGGVSYYLAPKVEEEGETVDATTAIEEESKSEDAKRMKVEFEV